MPHSHRLLRNSLHPRRGRDPAWTIHIGRFSVSHPETKAETKCPKTKTSRAGSAAEESPRHLNHKPGLRDGVGDAGGRETRRPDRGDEELEGFAHTRIATRRHTFFNPTDDYLLF